jgi:hypothetical protein
MEEVEALGAIYGEQWQVVGEGVFCMHVTTAAHPPMALHIILPQHYPSTMAPIYQIDATWSTRPEAPHIAESLDIMYAEQV